MTACELLARYEACLLAEMGWESAPAYFDAFNRLRREHRVAPFNAWPLTFASAEHADEVVRHIDTLPVMASGDIKGMRVNVHDSGRYFLVVDDASAPSYLAIPKRSIDEFVQDPGV